MNEKELSKDEAVPETESGEENETPQPKVPADWSMPEPQFQQTSGYLPQGFLKQVEGDPGNRQGGDVLEIPAITAPQAASDQQAAEASAEPLLEITEAAAAPIVRDSPVVPTPPAVNIEPQPDLSEQISEDASIEPPPAPVAAQSSGFRTVLTILGVIAMLVVLAVFLAFVYLYFIAAPGAANNF